MNRSLAGEKIEFGEETYDAVWLLSKFIQMSLHDFPEIEGIVFTWFCIDRGTGTDAQRDRSPYEY